MRAKSRVVETVRPWWTHEVCLVCESAWTEENKQLIYPFLVLTKMNIG